MDSLHEHTCTTVEYWSHCSDKMEECLGPWLVAQLGPCTLQLHFHSCNQNSVTCACVLYT